MKLTALLSNSDVNGSNVILNALSWLTTFTNFRL